MPLTATTSLQPKTERCAPRWAPLARGPWRVPHGAVLLAFAAAVVSINLAARGAYGEGISFADWILECAPGAQEKRQCSLRQTITDGKGRRIVQLVAARNGKTTYLDVVVPLGIFIPYSVTLNLAENAKLAMQVVDCDKTGCRAVIPLDDKALARMKSAKSVSVTFQDSKSGKLLTVEGSLNGFAQGIAMILAAS